MASSSVKSTAVVKYCNVETPAKYLELQRNTNLNEPPANWLHGNTKWENYIRDFSLGKERLFSSFKMAHCFPDLMGEIDVVSDAENIKKLLKMPWSKGHISMMVHRVGSTLLLDDFDVHKYLLRQQQDDWQWLRKFYYETILESMQENLREKCVVKKNKSRDHLAKRNMFSKFLYYSVAEEDCEEEPSCGNEDSEGVGALGGAEASLPDPLPQPGPGQTGHQRTLAWSFENIHMLIGTDLPIFGEGTHPCISLRLRECRKPINVLTGLDYWLDNLMCNVPELAMCYHLDGIVQSYELIKTEDIPDMKDSRFDVKVVRGIAQNILSFLKANATKEGHTYWLFKGQEDDIVKLYDLTTLCPDYTEDRNANPFTVPVGILLYRVARNMRQRHGRKKSGTIRTLLKNSLLLLDKDIHSQVVTSAHYLLSDLFIPNDIYNLELSPQSSDESDTEEEHNQVMPDGEDGTSSSTVGVEALCRPDHFNKLAPQDSLQRYPPVSGNVEERCLEALAHVTQAVVCLDQNIRSQVPQHVVEHQKSCKPSKAIPLHYEPLQQTLSTTNQEPSTSSSEEQPSQVSVINKTSIPSSSWHVLSKALLLLKASVAYCGLAEVRLNHERYGVTLKYIKMAACCFCAMTCIKPSKAEENMNVLSRIMSLSGDAHLMLVRSAKRLASHREDFEAQSKEETLLMESAQAELAVWEYKWLTEFSLCAEDNMEKSMLSYRVAIEIAKKSCIPKEKFDELTKRCGNVQNECGVYYMNQASALIKEGDKEKCQRVEELRELSEKSFNAGILAFQSLGDKINMALLHSNLGRLMRLSAQGHIQYRESGQKARQFSPQEKRFFSKAQKHYKVALSLLGRRENCPEIWDSISWELSSSYFYMASLLQDFAPLKTMATEQVEKEVTELMMKALDYCEVDIASVHQPTRIYRAATIHHRLASLHHNSYRNQEDDKQRKHHRLSAENHYQHACTNFRLAESPCELIRVLLERVALCEYQLNNQTSQSSRGRTLKCALEFIMECRHSLEDIVTRLSSDSSKKDFESYEEEAAKLISILHCRLQFVLHNLVKNASYVTKSKPKVRRELDVYKAMYACVLKKAPPGDSDCSLGQRCQNQLDLLREVDALGDKLQQTSAKS